MRINAYTQAIDADSHFMEPVDWLEQVDMKVAAEFREKVPVPMIEQVLGEILGSIPEEQRPPIDQIVPESYRVGFERLQGTSSAKEMAEMIRDSEMNFIFNPKGGRDPVERIAFCDEHGIDKMLINATLAAYASIVARKKDPLLGMKVAECYNRWASDTVAGYQDRLIPVSLIQLDDLDWTIRELTKMREKGSRAYTLPMEPQNGRSLGDKHYDRLWSASTDLGMTPIMHSAFGRFPLDPDWFGHGDEFDPIATVCIFGSLHYVIPAIALSTMIFRGVFDRHPKLTVLCQEFGIAWVEEWFERLGPVSRRGRTNQTQFFGWNLKRSHEDILRENLLFSAIRGEPVDRVVEIYGSKPFVFATDYPHPEGLMPEWNYYEQILNKFGEDVKYNFYRGNMERLLA